MPPLEDVWKKAWASLLKVQALRGNFVLFLAIFRGLVPVERKCFSRLLRAVRYLRGSQNVSKCSGQILALSLDTDNSLINCVLQPLLTRVLQICSLLELPSSVKVPCTSASISPLLCARKQPGYSSLVPFGVLDDHEGEVWCSSFSPDGRFLATGSANGKILIYAVVSRNIKLVARLLGRRCTESISWNVDSSKLIATGGIESSIYLWNMDSFTQRPKSAALSSQVMDLNVSMILRIDSDEVLSTCWVPGHESIFYSSNVSGSLLCWDIQSTASSYYTGNQVASSKYIRKDVSLPFVASDMAITSDLSHFVFLSTEGRIIVYTFASIHGLDRDGIASKLLPLTNIYVGKQYLPSSIVLCSNNYEVLVAFSASANFNSSCMNAKTIELWDLRKRACVQSCTTSMRMVDAPYTTRSAFLGHQNYFAVSGDENGNISMLQRKSLMRNTSVAGHFGSINFVETSPVDKEILVTCGDDQVVRVWRVGEKKQ